MSDTNERTLAIRMIARNDRFTAEMARSRRQLRDFGGETRRMQTMVRGFGRELLQIAGVGGGLYAVGHELRNIAGAAIQFESEFAGVRKTVNATEQEFSQLYDQLLDVSAATGLDSTSVFGIGEAAGQLGIETENIAKFAREMSEMAVTTNLTSDEAATAFARWAEITKLPQKEIGRLTSTVVALGNNTATTEAEIVQLGLRLAAAGRQVGASDADIAALAAGMSGLGVQAEAGGTAVSRILKEISKQVQTDGKSLRVFGALTGQTVDEFKQSFKEDAAGALLDFAGGLDRLKAAGGNVLGVLDDLGLADIRVSDSLLRMSGGVDGLRSALKLAREEWVTNTARAKEAAQRFNTVENNIKETRAELQNLRAELGGAFMESMDGAIVGTGDWLGEIRELNDALKRTGGLVGGIVGPITALTRGFYGQGEDGLFGVFGALAEYHRHTQGMAAQASASQSGRGAAIDAERAALDARMHGPSEDDLALMQALGGAGFSNAGGRDDSGFVQSVEAEASEPYNETDGFRRKMIAFNERLREVVRERAASAREVANAERDVLATQRDQIGGERQQARERRAEQQLQVGTFRSERAGFMRRGMSRLVTSGDSMPAMARQAVQDSSPKNREAGLLQQIVNNTKAVASNTAQQPMAVLG